MILARPEDQRVWVRECGLLLFPRAYDLGSARRSDGLGTRMKTHEKNKKLKMTESVGEELDLTFEDEDDDLVLKKCG